MVVALKDARRLRAEQRTALDLRYSANTKVYGATTQVFVPTTTVDLVIELDSADLIPVTDSPSVRRISADIAAALATVDTGADTGVHTLPIAPRCDDTPCTLHGAELRSLVSVKAEVGAPCSCDVADALFDIGAMLRVQATQAVFRGTVTPEISALEKVGEGLCEQALWSRLAARAEATLDSIPG